MPLPQELLPVLARQQAFPQPVLLERAAAQAVTPQRGQPVPELRDGAVLPKELKVWPDESEPQPV